MTRPAYNPSELRPGEEGKVPSPGLLPVVAEERDLAGEASRANVPQVAREAERLVAQEQQGGDHQTDDRARDVPGPGAGQDVGHGANLGGSSLTLYPPPPRPDPSGTPGTSPVGGL